MIEPMIRYLSISTAYSLPISISTINHSADATYCDPLSYRASLRFLHLIIDLEHLHGRPQPDKEDCQDGTAR